MSKEENHINEEDIDNEKSIIYPIFYKMTEYATDDGWREIFHNAAHGILPNGFKYLSGKLIYQQDSNKAKYKLHICGDANKAALECKKFMRRHKIRTDQELAEDQKKLDKRKKRGWASIRNEYLQHEYLYNYTDELREKYKLDANEVMDLRHLIFLENLTGNINAKNIEFNNGYISNILGLDWEDTTRQFKFNLNIVD